MNFNHFNRGIPQLPPSPSEPDLAEMEEQYRRAAPPSQPPESRSIDGKKYNLVVVQEPVRARMCGFGEKDRRPITMPPIIRGVICDENTNQEIDYKNSDIELTHFVCQVCIYDATGTIDKSIVKCNPNQSIISASCLSGFPAAEIPQSPSRVSSRVPPTDSTYIRLHGPQEQYAGGYGQHYIPAPQSMLNNPVASQYSNPVTAYSMPYGHPYASTSQMMPNNFQPGPYSNTGPPGNALFPPAAGPPTLSIPSTNNFVPAPTPYGQASSHGVFPAPNHTQMTSVPNQPPTPPLGSGESSGGPGFSRNLIGSHSTSAQLLEDLEGRPGLFFIFSDLSVRSEDWFRLKFTLYNIGDMSHMSHEEVFMRADDNNSAPTTGPNYEAGRSGSKRLEGLRSGLVGHLAPCLASVFSQPFKVYTAKRFPGVIETTALNRKFAKQGVRISIRKELEKGEKKGKKRRRDDDDDDNDEDEDDDE